MTRHDHFNNRRFDAIAQASRAAHTVHAQLDAVSPDAEGTSPALRNRKFVKLAYPSTSVGLDTKPASGFAAVASPVPPKQPADDR